MIGDDKIVENCCRMSTSQIPLVSKGLRIVSAGARAGLAPRAFVRREKFAFLLDSSVLATTSLQVNQIHREIIRLGMNNNLRGRWLSARAGRVCKHGRRRFSSASSQQPTAFFYREWRHCARYQAQFQVSSANVGQKPHYVHLQPASPAPQTYPPRDARARERREPETGASNEGATT